MIRKAVGECNLGLSFGHVAWLGPALVAALEQRGVDWANAAIGENVSDYENPIPIAAGEVVAYPQIVGNPAALTPGYVVPDIESTSVWTQIEFSVNLEYRNELDEWEGYPVPVYRGLSAEEYATWTDVFVQNVLDPANPRYGSYGAQARKWLWAAEGELMLSPGFEATEAGSLTAALGSWWEGHPDCGSDATLCDEMITFFPIYRDTALFADVASGFDPDTRYAIAKVWGFDQSRIFGEVLQILDFAGGAYVPTTSLDATLRGALVLRLRTELAPEGTPLTEQILGHQAVGYDLDPVEGRLILSWGEVRATEELAAADVPAAPPTQAAPCTGESHVAGSTTCHYKRSKEGWVSAANVYP
ncbi:MAG: hypothetical protein H5U40_10505 [Polyangiaceae bacterium]|nr:hypothetical protein [Polyangiaceae bacterium]